MNPKPFSESFTWLNMLVSTLGYVVWQIWSSFTIEQWIFDSHPLLHTMLVISITFTALFLHFEILCYCCCIPRKQQSVYDPDLDKSFIMLDGEVVEDPKDDVETQEDDVETGTIAGVPDRLLHWTLNDFQPSRADILGRRGPGRTWTSRRRSLSGGGNSEEDRGRETPPPSYAEVMRATRRTSEEKQEERERRMRERREPGPLESPKSPRVGGLGMGERIK